MAIVERWPLLEVLLSDTTYFCYREEVNKEQDTFLWKQEIEEEVEETREEYEREYRRKMLTYEEEMAKYQKQQQAKVWESGFSLWLWPFTTLWVNSADNILKKLEPICMKCQILFSGINKKNISMCRLLKI